MLADTYGNSALDIDCINAEKTSEPTYANTADVNDGRSHTTGAVPEADPIYANTSAVEAEPEPNYAALELALPLSRVPPFATEVQYSEVQQESEEGAGQL